MAMFYYKSRIQYDGSDYAGFQWQNGLKTIQDDFNKTLAKFVDGKVTTVGASRTDTGVHAYHQIVKITAENPIQLSLESLNTSLPAQIKCLSLESCDGQFKPSAHTLSKEYRYLFTNQSKVEYDDRRFVANISAPLDLEKIKFCVEALRGEHDFCNFYSEGSNVKSTVRNIFSSELSLVNPHRLFQDSPLFIFPENLQSCFQLKISANGFLKQMIRHIVSALWMVGSGKLSTDDFLNLLNGPKSPKQNWKVAAPNGLFLYQITYREE